MYQHTLQLRVRYGETDQMGYVYYGHYAAYCEVARVEALRSLGMSYKQLEETGVMLPVLEHHAYYHRPALYDDLLSIEVTIMEMPTAVIRFRYQIYNEQRELLHTAETKLAFVRSEGMRVCRPPQQLLALLRPHFSDEAFGKNRENA